MPRRRFNLAGLGTRLRRSLWTWQTAWGTTSLIGTGVSVLSVSDPTIKLWAIAALGSSAVVALGWTVVSALRPVGSDYPLHVEYTRTTTEFDAAWHLGNAVYRSIRKHYPTQGLVKDWWERYPDGILRLCDAADNVWGYFSMWPVSPDTFQKLKSGDTSEDELSGYYIEPKGKGPFHYWYIADVCRKKRPAGSSSKFSDCLVGILVSETFRRLAEHNDFPGTIEVIAFAATTAGEDMLKKVGFVKVSPVSEDAKVKRIYVKTLTTLTVARIVEDFRRIALECEAATHNVLGAKS